MGFASVQSLDRWALGQLGQLAGYWNEPRGTPVILQALGEEASCRDACLPAQVGSTGLYPDMMVFCFLLMMPGALIATDTE